MPELPEVETIKRTLEPHLIGQKILCVQYNRPNIRFALPVNMPEIVQGKTIIKLTRRGKYILIQVEDAGEIVVHLGMSGRLLVEKTPFFLQGNCHSECNEESRSFIAFRMTTPHPNPLPQGERESSSFTAGEFYYDFARNQKHDHVIFEFANFRLVYNDPRRFGVIDFILQGQNAPHKLLENMGQEPWDTQTTGQWLFEIALSKKLNLKAFLLDQTIIAGIGNIYASEVLNLSKLSPLRLCNMLTISEANVLINAVRTTLEKAISLGGSTISDYQNSDGAAGTMQDEFRVYERAGQPCQNVNCSGILQKTIQNGRSTYFCEACQV